MKKVMFSAAILAFAGVTAISAANRPIMVNTKATIVQDTTDTAKKDTTEASKDTTSAPADTTQKGA